MALDFEGLPDNTPNPQPGNTPAAPSSGLSLVGLPDDTPTVLQNNYRSALDNPDEVIRARKAARLTGIPVATVKRNLPTVERAASEPDWHALSSSAPKTAAMLADVNLFQIANDDTVPLSGFERMLNAFGAGGAQAALGIAESIWRTPDALARGNRMAPDAVLQAISPNVRAGKVVMNALSQITNRAADRISESQQLLNDNPAVYGDAFQRISIKGQQADAALSRALSGDMQPLLGIATDPEAWSGFLGQAAPSIYTAYKSGGSIPFMAWLEGMQTASDAADFEKKTGQKIAPAKFAQAFAQAATVNALLEKYGIDKVLGVKGAGIAGILKATVSEGGTEGLQQFNSNLSQYLAYNPEQNLGAGVVGSVMGGAGTGGAMSTALSLGDIASRSMAKSDTAAKLNANAEMLKALGENAAQSKLLARSPEEFRRAIDAMAAETGSETVFISAQELSNTLAQSGKATTTPAITEQLQLALEHNGDVVMPLGEFTQLIADPDLRGLADHARFEPFANSAAEVRQWEAEQGTNFQTELEQKLQDNTIAATENAQVTAITENIARQLEQTGRFRPEVNQVYAAMQGAFYATQAARNGMSVTDFAAAHPLTVVAEGPVHGARISKSATAAIGRVLAGEVMVNARENYRVQKVGDNQFSWSSLPGKTEFPTETISEAEVTARLSKGQTTAKDSTLRQAGKDRGSFNPDTNTIALLKQADLSTFLHESGHFWLETLAKVAVQPTASEATKRDMQIILQWFGVKDLKTWQAMNLDEKRAMHEQFARGTEAYFFEGKAPTLELQGVFSRFRAWLVHLYKTLFALDVELSDEVRGVFDRLLATDKQIAEAAQIRGGRPIFTTKPASMNEMEWLEYQAMGADAADTALATYQARRLKDLAAMRTKVGRTAYKAMRIQVENEVAQRPIYSVQTYLKTGKLPNGATAGDPVKLSIPAMKQLFGDDAEAPWRQLSTGPKGMTSQSGVHPDIVAEQFGFSSGDAMIHEIVAAPSMADAVKTETQQRFAEEYGDDFTAEGINTAVLDELSNEGRAQQLVAELNVLRRTTGSTQLVYKAAKEHAARTVGNMPVKRARNAVMHTAAEARAARAAENAFAAGDLKTAAEAKRDQVLNNQLARAAKHAREEVQDAIDRTRAYFKADSTLGKLRDMDLVNGARAILAAHGLGTASKSAAAYAESIRKNDPETWADIEPMVSEALANPKDYRDMTLDDFRGMIETVETLWHLSRRTRQIEIDGQLIDREEVVAQLTDMIRLKGQPYLNLGYDQAITKWQESKFGLLGVRAALRRVESWVTAMDVNDTGVFRRYIWQPISESVDAYREDKTKHLKQYLKLVEGLTIPQGKIEAPELGYSFNSKAELLHAILHTGNESNLSKLLRGRNWGQYKEDGTVDVSAWKRFIWRASQDGILQKSDFEFAQGVWDLLESMKPAAQKAHRDMYGFYFNEITATPVETPFGTFRGGYVPAIVDSRIVTDAAMRNEQENVLSGNNSFMFPTTGRGFTKGRVEGYAKPLLLDLGFLPSHIDKVLRFAHIEPHIKDVARIVKNSRGFGQAMDALDPTARTDMLIPWLQRTATQRVETPSQGRGGRAADKFFHALRTRTGLNIMTANVVNTLQQITGLSSAMLKVKPHFMRNALWQYVKQPKQTAASVSEKSTFMAHRVSAQAMEVQQHIDDLLLDPTKYEQAKAFAQKHGYFMQAAAQNVVDLITWSGAYEQAVQRGSTEIDAVRAADSAVRETQGSFSPEDMSRFESGTPFVRAFTMFYSYFNMQANLLGTEFANTAQSMGLRKGAGRMFYVYLFGVAIPAVMAEAIVRGAAGSGFDDDEDGDVDLWDVLSITLGAQGRFLMGMIPAAGPAVMAGINAFNDKWYDDRISTSPVVSSIESAVRAPHSIYKAMAEDGNTKRAVRDTLTAVGLMTGLPVAPLARPLGYLADVEEGKARADNPVDITRGLVTGRSAKE